MHDTPQEPAARHWPFLLLGIAVPLAASLLIVVDRERVALVFFPEAPLPHSCWSRSVLGIDCPACGLTRSIVYLVHGRLADSLATHRMGWMVLLLIVAQVPYRAWRMASCVPIRSSRALSRFLWIGLLVMLVLNRLWDAAAAL